MNKSNRAVIIFYSVYALFLGIAFAMIAFFGFFMSDKSASNYVDYSSDWHCLDGRMADFSKIMGNMTVSKDISRSDHNKTFAMRVKNVNVKIYLDDELHSSYGFDIAENVHYKSLGTYYVSVFLGEHSKITMDIYSVYDNDTSCNIKSMLVGDITDIYNDRIESMLPGFCVSLLIFALGCIFCVSAFALRKYGPQAVSLVSLGVFGVVFGLWSGLEMQLLQYITGSIGACHIGIHLSLMFITIPLLIFFKQRGATKKNIGTYCAIFLAAGTFIVSTILHFTGLRDFHETIKVTHISILFGCLLTLFYGYHIFKNSKGKDSSFWGLSIVGVCTAIDLVMYYLQITSDSSLFIKAGVMSYLVLLVIGIIREYAKAYSANLRAKMLEQMAYEDLLTGFYNHNMFISDMKIMDKEFDKNRGKSILIFDMNCLKYINDTLGHTMGDTALQECASFISDVFGDIGKCYRTGGDEFAVITNYCIMRQSIDELYDKFLTKMNVRNGEGSDSPYPLYIAFGYEIIETSTHDALQKADANMYKNKLEIKDKLIMIDPRLVRS